MTQTVSYGPRLAAHPTGALRVAMLVAPGPGIENARPLAGELNAIATRAAAQQEILAKTLRFFGCEVTTMQFKSTDPYACVIADAAVVFENGVVVMRPSAMSRRPQAAWLENELAARDVPIAGHIAAPGLIDGSDVLLVGNTAFIGRSKRSNALGRNGFAKIAKAHGFEVREVQLRDTSATLRCLAGALSANSVVLAPQANIDHQAFAGFEIFTAPPGHERGAGVLNLGDHHVLANMRYPAVADMLRRAGIVVEAIDLHDFGRVGITPSMLALDLKRL
jgi:dimethylargininase